jgi:hypothetical protein
MRPPPPSLGNDLESVHRGWREVSRSCTSTHVVSAFIPLVGRFAMRGDAVVALHEERDRHGGATSYRAATAAEHAEIDAAILSGTLQIEARTASGALGRGGPSELVRVYHQATGRRLPREANAETPHANQPAPPLFEEAA